METKILIFLLVISAIFNLVYAVKLHKRAIKINLLKKRNKNLFNELKECKTILDRKSSIIKQNIIKLNDMLVEADNLKNEVNKIKSEVMTNSVLKVPKSVTMIDENGVFKKKFRSIHEASKETGISRKTILKYAKNGKVIKGFKFKFI